MSYSPWGGAPPQQQQPPPGHSYPAAAAAPGGPTPGAYNPYGGAPAPNQAPPGVYTPPVASPTQPYTQPYPGGAAQQPYAQPAQPYGAPYAQQPYGTAQPTQPAVVNPYATAGQAPAPMGQAPAPMGQPPAPAAQPAHSPAPQKPTQGPPPAHSQEPEMITQPVDCAPGYDLIAATQPRLQGHVPTATMTAHEANVVTAIAPQHVQHAHITPATTTPNTTTTATSASAPPTDILPTAPPVPTENIVPFTFHAAHHHIQTHNQQLYIGHHPLHHSFLKVVCRVVSKDAGQIVFADITGDISSTNPHVVGWDLRIGDVVELYCTAYPPQPGSTTHIITPYSFKLLTPQQVLPEQHAVKMMHDHLAACHAWYNTYAFGAAALADMIKLKGDAVIKFQNPYFIIPLTCAQFNQNIQFDPVTHRAMYGSLDVTNRLVSRCVNTISVGNCTQANNNHNPGFSCSCGPSCHIVHLDDGAPLLGTPPVQVAAVHFDPTKPPYCHAPAVGQTIELVSFITATPSQLQRSEKAILLPDPSPTAQQHGGYNVDKLHHHKKTAEDVWRNLQQQPQQQQQQPPTAAYPAPPYGQQPQYPVQPQQQYPYGAQGQPQQPQQQQQQPNVNITNIHITNNTYNHQQNLHHQQPIIAPPSQGGVMSAEERRAQDIQYRLQQAPHTVTAEERTFITYWTQTHHVVVAPQAHIIEVVDGKKAKKEKKFKAKDVKKDKKDGKIKAPKPPKVGKVPKPAGVCYGSSTSDYWTSDSD